MKQPRSGGLRLRPLPRLLQVDREKKKNKIAAPLPGSSGSSSSSSNPYIRGGHGSAAAFTDQVRARNNALPPGLLNAMSGLSASTSSLLPGRKRPRRLETLLGYGSDAYIANAERSSRPNKNGSFNNNNHDGLARPSAVDVANQPSGGSRILSPSNNSAYLPSASSLFSAINANANPSITTSGVLEGGPPRHGMNNIPTTLFKRSYATRAREKLDVFCSPASKVLPASEKWKKRLPPRRRIFHLARPLDADEADRGSGL